MGETFKPSSEQQEDLETVIPIYKVPFRAATEQAYIEWPPQKTPEEAREAVSTLTNEQLESERYATGSVESGLKGMMEYLQEKGVDTSDINLDELHADVFGPEEPTAEVPQTGALKMLGEKIKSLESPEALVVGTLASIHDGWTRGAAKKFFDREKKHQHMPLELIGWKEASADLLFLKPILEGAGVDLTEDQIQFSYYERVADFQEKNGTSTQEGLISAIQQADAFYPALKDQTEIINFMKTPEGAAIVAKQIEEKGIGADTGYQAYLEAKAEQEAAGESEA